MLKKLMLFLGILLAAATSAQAIDYFSDANISACERQLPDMDNGANMCRLLEDLDDNFAGTTSSTGAYDIGFDAAGGFSGANVGAALTELTSVTGSGTAGSQIIGVDVTTVTGPFDTCVNVEECLVELTVANDAQQGANIIGFDDSGTQTAKATVADALDQTYTVINRVWVSPYDFRECSGGDVNNAEVAATDGSGGILASDTTPTLIGAATSAQAVQWVTTNEDTICAQIGLGPAFSGATLVTFNFYVAADVADGDATEEFEIITNWLAVGTPVADVATATTGALAATDTDIQILSTTVGAASIPDAAIALSMAVKPDLNTNNNLWLFGIEIVFVAE